VDVEPSVSDQCPIDFAEREPVVDATSQLTRIHPHVVGQILAERTGMFVGELRRIGQKLQTWRTFDYPRMHPLVEYLKSPVEEFHQEFDLGRRADFK
jgi:hypothetical protein